MNEFESRGFSYSQSNLAILTQCQRHFFLRYVRRLQWPAPLTIAQDDYERAISRGRLFHSMVVQEALGMDLSGMVRHCNDVLLEKWWHNYLHHSPAGVPHGPKLSEAQVSVPLGKNRLLARFDRVVLGEDGRVWIVDWKTGKNPPAAETYKDSWQTLVYRYVMAEGGAVLTQGQLVVPEQIIMVYWHPGFPEQLQSIGYSQSEHGQVRSRLESQVEALRAHRFEGDFPKTQDEVQCGRCQYRTYCNRGRVPACEWEVDEEEMDWAVLPEVEE